MWITTFFFFFFFFFYSSVTMTTAAAATTTTTTELKILVVPKYNPPNIIQRQSKISESCNFYWSLNPSHLSNFTQLLWNWSPLNLTIVTK
jgi:hypothetical protein